MADGSYTFSQANLTAPYAIVRRETTSIPFQGNIGTPAWATAYSDGAWANYPIAGSQQGSNGMWVFTIPAAVDDSGDGSGVEITIEIRDNPAGSFDPDPANDPIIDAPRSGVFESTGGTLRANVSVQNIPEASVTGPITVTGVTGTIDANVVEVNKHKAYIEQLGIPARGGYPSKFGSRDWTKPSADGSITKTNPTTTGFSGGHGAGSGPSFVAFELPALFDLTKDIDIRWDVSTLNATTNSYDKTAAPPTYARFAIGFALADYDLSSDAVRLPPYNDLSGSLTDSPIEFGLLFDFDINNTFVWLITRQTISSENRINTALAAGAFGTGVSNNAQLLASSGLRIDGPTWKMLLADGTELPLGTIANPIVADGHAYKFAIVADASFPGITILAATIANLVFNGTGYYGDNYSIQAAKGASGGIGK